MNVDRAGAGGDGEVSREAPSSPDTSLTVLAGVPFLMVLGNSMLFPLFPYLQSALGLSGVQTSLVVTAFSVPAGVLIPLAGYLSDRLGRRPVMAPGVALFGLGALVAGLSPVVLGAGAYHGVLAGRVLQGAGAAGMSQLAMAMTADLFSGRSRARALGLIEAANGLGKVVSPVAGAVVGLIAWFAPFYVFALLSAPLAALILVVTRDRKAPLASRSLGAYLRDIGAIFRDRGRALSVGLVSGAAVLFVLFGTLFYLSEVLEKTYHVPEIPAGLILAIPVGALSVCSYVVGLGLQKRRPLARPAVLAGIGLLAAVMAAAVFVRGLAALAVVVSFMGVGGGLALPSLNLLVTSSAGAAQRGLITSLYGAVRFFGVALGPPAFGLVMRRGEPVLFGSAAVLAAAVGVLALVALSARQLLGGGGGGQGKRTAERYSPAGARVGQRLR
jgi:ACDE family multidrug resistance protein